MFKPLAPWFAAALIGLGAAVAQLPAQAADGAAAAATVGQAPEALIKQVSTEVLDALRADTSIKQGDVQKVVVLVDQKVMPHLDFQRMTASAVGRYWRQATPAQQQKLQEQFKLLLVRTYAGALAQVTDQTVTIKPSRAASADAKDTVVRTEVRGKGDPIQLDYRLEQAGGGWKIFDVNVMGVWLVDNYRNSFAQEIGSGGIDGLIAKLQQRNQGAAGSKG